MEKISRASIIFGLMCLVTVARTGVSAHDSHSCRNGLPDAPALAQHIEQSQITNGRLSLDEVIAAGRTIFDANFNRCDGRGRPATTGAGDRRDPINQPEFLRTSAPDSNSCAGCHNRPSSGGGGDFVTSVFVLAHALDPVIESVSPEFSNERHTIGMFGSGPIEMLAREMTADLHAIRKIALGEAAAMGRPVTRPLETKGVNFGSLTARPDGTLDTGFVRGVDPELIVKPFHQAGVVVSLREFTVNAMNHHHGMQAEERFDLNSDKGVDFDQDGIERELTIGDITVATLFQATLTVPQQVLPRDPTRVAKIKRGEGLFAATGCISCHMPELRLKSVMFSEPNPYNPVGTWSDTSQTVSFDMTTGGQGARLVADGNGAIVRAFTDLKRHSLCDPVDRADAIRFFCNETLAQDRHNQGGHPGTEYFLTAKLWDTGAAASFGHRGDISTIAEAILYHAGEARKSRDAFTALPYDDQVAVVEFIRSLTVAMPGDRVRSGTPNWLRRLLGVSE